MLQLSNVLSGGGTTTVDPVELLNVVKTTDTTIVATWVLDEDDFASNSDVHVATQQSIKAYVDTQISLNKSWNYVEVIGPADIPAVPKSFYLVDTSAGPVTITLPPGTEYDVYGFADAGNNFDVHPVSVLSTAPDTIVNYGEVSINSKYACYTIVYVNGQFVFTSGEDFVDETGGAPAPSGFINEVTNVGGITTTTTVNIDWSTTNTYTAIVDAPGVATFNFTNLPVDKHQQIHFFLRYAGGAFSFPNNVAWSGMPNVGDQYIFEPGYDYLIIFDAMGGTNIGAGVAIKTPGALF